MQNNTLINTNFRTLIRGSIWGAALALVLGVSYLPPCALGADYSLTGSNPSSGVYRDWSNTSFWTPTGYPNGATDIANINIAWSSSGRGLTVDSDMTVNQLLVGTSNSTTTGFGSVAIKSSTGNALSIGASGADGYFGVGSTTGDKGAQGTLTFETGVVVTLHGGSFDVASRASSSGVSNTGLQGTVTVGSGAVLNVGTSANRTEWNIARTISTDSYQLRGTVDAASGSSVNASLTTLRVAVMPGNSTGGVAVDSYGTLNLSNATVKTFDVSGDVEIGRGRKWNGSGSGNLTGTWNMGNASVSIGGDLLVGDIAAYDKTKGFATFNGTQVAVAGNFVIGEHGDIDVKVNGISAGIELGASSTLTINATNGYSITFEEPNSLDTLYYGLSWEGNHLTALQSLITGSKISWINNTSYDIDAYYNVGENLTYVGVIPEPNTAILAMSGMVCLLFLSRRRPRVSGRLQP